MKTLVLALLLLLSVPGLAQSDSTAHFLRVRNINVVSTTASFQSKQPAYSDLLQDFSRPPVLQGFNNAAIDPSKGFSSNFSGFKIAFLFDGKLLEESRWIDFLSASFETGRHRMDLFRIVQSDSSLVDYTMNNEAFRVTFGARKLLTKKNRRFRFFSGLDWIHEVHISSFLFEDDRRLFAKKKYSTYLNVPLGVEWRFLGRKEDYAKYKALFFALHFGGGLQNTDPYRLLGSYVGTSFGLSFTI